MTRNDYGIPVSQLQFLYIPAKDWSLEYWDNIKVTVDVKIAQNRLSCDKSNLLFTAHSDYQLFALNSWCCTLGVNTIVNIISKQRPNWMPIRSMFTLYRTYISKRLMHQEYDNMILLSLIISSWDHHVQQKNIVICNKLVQGCFSQTLSKRLRLLMFSVCKR